VPAKATPTAKVGNDAATGTDQLTLEVEAALDHHEIMATAVVIGDRDALVQANARSLVYLADLNVELLAITVADSFLVVSSPVRVR